MRQSDLFDRFLGLLKIYEGAVSEHHDNHDGIRSGCEDSFREEPGLVEAKEKARRKLIEFAKYQLRTKKERKP